MSRSSRNIEYRCVQRAGQRSLSVRGEGVGCQTLLLHGSEITPAAEEAVIMS